MILVVFILVFIIFYGKVELFKFPFISDVWGTASDWVMILVTAITAYFLWKTLNAQTKSIAIQNETLVHQEQIAKIERHKYIENIKPEFELEITNIRTREVSEATTRLVMDVSLTSKSNKALDVKILSYTNPFFPNKTKFLHSEKDVLERNETWSVLFRNAYALNFTEKDGTDAFMLAIDFEVKFHDIERNPYSQSFLFYCNKKGDQRLTSYPVKSDLSSYN